MIMFGKYFWIGLLMTLTCTALCLYLEFAYPQYRVFFLILSIAFGWKAGGWAGDMQIAENRAKQKR